MHIGRGFERYGRFMAKHPFKVVIIIGIIDIGLGLGLLKLEKETGIEQYTPTDSEASKNQETVM